MATKKFTLKKNRSGGFNLRIFGEFVENTLVKGFHLTWEIDPKEVKNIVLHGESGVTTLGDGAFADFDNLQSIDFQVQLVVIGSCIFSQEAWGTLKQIKVDPRNLHQVAQNPIFELCDCVPIGPRYPGLPTVVFSQEPLDNEVLCGLRPYSWSWVSQCRNGNDFQLLVKHEPYCSEIYHDKNEEGKKCHRTHPDAVLWGNKLEYDMEWQACHAQVVCLKERRKPEVSIAIQFGGHEDHYLDLSWNQCETNWVDASSTIRGLVEEQHEELFGPAGCFGEFFKYEKHDVVFLGITKGGQNQSCDLELDTPSKCCGGLLHAYFFGDISQNGGDTIKVEAEPAPGCEVDEYWDCNLNSKLGCKLRSWRQREKVDDPRYDVTPEQFASYGMKAPQRTWHGLTSSALITF